MEKKESESFEVKDKRRFVVDPAGEAQGDEETPKAEERQRDAPPPRKEEPAAKGENEAAAGNRLCHLHSFIEFQRAPTPGARRKSNNP